MRTSEDWQKLDHWEENSSKKADLVWTCLEKGGKPSGKEIGQHKNQRNVTYLRGKGRKIKETSDRSYGGRKSET